MTMHTTVPRSLRLESVILILSIVCCCISGLQMTTPRLLNVASLGVSNASSNRLVETLFNSPLRSAYGPTTRTSSTCRSLTKPSYYMKRLDVIKQSPWVSSLRNVLAEMKFQHKKTDLLDVHQEISSRKQVTVVFGDANYALSLLNWLVSALVQTNPPLENVIVISIDEELQALLDRKEIRSVHVNPETITCGVVHRKISRIWVARCAVYRLLNHWGYDVMAYDTDSIVFKNLQDVFGAYPESDIVGSAGYYPFELGAKWGQTLCLGVVLFRSTRNTETLWNIISRAKRMQQFIFDDQVNVNNALNSCNISWISNTSNKIVTGECQAEDKKLQGLRVTILPFSMICRRCSKKDKENIYVWHKQSKKTGEMKMKMAVSTQTWYLRNLTLSATGARNLLEIREIEELKGLDWIRAIAQI